METENGQGSEAQDKCPGIDMATQTDVVEACNFNDAVEAASTQNEAPRHSSSYKATGNNKAGALNGSPKVQESDYSVEEYEPSDLARSSDPLSELNESSEALPATGQDHDFSPATQNSQVVQHCLNCCST